MPPSEGLTVQNDLSHLMCKSPSACPRRSGRRPLMSGRNLTDLMPPPNRVGNLCPLQQLFRLFNFYKIGPPCQLCGQGSWHIPLIGLSYVPRASLDGHAICRLTLPCIKYWADFGCIVRGCLTAWNFSFAKGRHFEKCNVQSCRHFVVWNTQVGFSP